MTHTPTSMRLTLFTLAAMAAIVLGAPATAKADSSSPVGTWRTIDDNTNKPRSLIKIWENKGKLYGKVIKLFDPPEPNPLCDKCEGKLHNKPVIGMVVMNDLKQDGSEWSGGRILDPESGNTYKCLIEVEDGGKKLKVRGYIGISLIGRTQYWHRVK